MLGEHSCKSLHKSSPYTHTVFLYFNLQTAGVWEVFLSFFIFWFQKGCSAGHLNQEWTVLPILCPLISLWVQRETDLGHISVRYIILGGSRRAQLPTGSLAAPAPCTSLLCEEHGSTINGCALVSVLGAPGGKSVLGSWWKIYCFQEWDLDTLSSTVTWRLQLIAEEEPGHRYTSLQKLQGILHSWACQARSSTAKVTLWHVPVIGSLWSCGCKERGQLFYVLWNKKKCQTTRFCDNVIARLIGTCISKRHRENLHLSVGRVSQNDFVPVPYWMCITHI